MASRYFFTESAARVFAVNGRNYQFTPTDTVGVRLVGVLEATTPEAVADLLTFVGRGVVEISVEDFEAEKKRTKPPGSSASSRLKPVSVQAPRSLDLGAQPAPVKQPDPDQSVRIVSLASVLRTGKVSSPKPVSGDERLNTK